MRKTNRGYLSISGRMHLDFAGRIWSGLQRKSFSRIKETYTCRKTTDLRDDSRVRENVSFRPT